MCKKFVTITATCKTTVGNWMKVIDPVSSHEIRFTDM